MRKSTLVTIILLLTASVGYSQMMKMEEAVITKEKEIYEALKKGDLEVFKKNVSDELIAVYKTGYATKDEEIESLSNMTMDSYELSDIKVLNPAENVATIIYTLDASGIYKDKEFDGTFYSTSTWVKSDGKWQAILHTETKAAPMEETMGMEEEME